MFVRRELEQGARALIVDQVVRMSLLNWRWRGGGGGGRGSRRPPRFLPDTPARGLRRYCGLHSSARGTCDLRHHVIFFYFFVTSVLTGRRSEWMSRRRGSTCEGVCRARPSLSHRSRETEED